METQTETTLSNHATTQHSESGTEKSKSSKIIGMVVLAGALSIGGYFGVKHLLFALHHETTDNAQVEGHIYPVLSRASGQIQRVLVEDNQFVKQGDLLFTIDSADYVVRRDQALAALVNAQASVELAIANAESVKQSLAGVKATIVSAKANVDQLSLDLKRNRNLYAQKVIPKSQLDVLETSYVAANAQLQAAQAQYRTVDGQYQAALKQVTVAQSVVKLRQEDVRNADLQLSYTVVTAPVQGTISQKKIEQGELIQIGQSALAISGKEQPWIVANFKETQLEHMRVGMPAIIEVDAYPGVEFQGKIESFSSATGARFSLLPPDNATGNFVKVTQRVPVKIVFTDPLPAETPLRPGMNVEAIIDISSK